MDIQTEVLDAFIRRWHGIQGVVATSMDGRTIGGALTRYGAAVLDEVLTLLEGRGLEDIVKPLPFLMGCLRRKDSDQQKQAADQARAAAAVVQTQEAIAQEQQRVRDEVALAPTAQGALLQRMSQAVREMAGRPVEEKERVLASIAEDAIREVRKRRGEGAE